MSVITRVWFEHPHMALADTIKNNPEVTLRVVPEAGTDPEHDVYFFLLEEGDPDAVRDSLAADHTVEDHYHASAYDEQWVFGVRLVPETVLMAPKLTAEGGIAIEAKTATEGWLERWQLPDREALHSIWQQAEEESFDLDIVELYRSDESVFDSGIGLTDEQRETLLTAYANGYFEEPRGVSLEELATMLDISPSAVGGRLRRGTERLIESVLVENP
ncbi:hypothetical protein BRD00_08570 [Halobacteriales archaeon QS_8_69_26]|nr:MAG: hypothetical protein BRD00_08570 [Halobacteriales archaeon QS_8_69_26]